jgi:spermidine/putrescine transport system permease protein
MLVVSFGRRGTLGGFVLDWNLDAYRALLDPTYVGILVRSVAYAALTTAICVVVAYPVAWTIGRADERRRTRLLVLVMVPFWTSFLIRTYAWVTILKSEGLLNGLLLQLGLVARPLEMLYTPGAVVLGLVYTFLPFMILPIYASVEKLDPALVEAALDLGARPLRAFARVLLPLTAPGVAAGVLLVFVPALGLYAVNDLLGGGRVDMIGNVIENQFKGTARNWPFGAALGSTLLVAFALAYWLMRSAAADPLRGRAPTSRA